PRLGAGALRWAPVVGAALGALAGGLLVGLAALGVPTRAAGLLGGGVLALATRGLHVDGRAHAGEGLGWYGRAERALAVMRAGGLGASRPAAGRVVLGVGPVPSGARPRARPWVGAHGAQAPAAAPPGSGWVAGRGAPPQWAGGFGA